MPISAAAALAQVCSERLDALDAHAARVARDSLAVQASQLGHLAWSRGLDYWDPAWPESVKRQLVSQIPAGLRTRGTRMGLIRAIEAFLAEVVIEEWWETGPPGTPGTATATVLLGTDLGTSIESQETLLRIIHRESRLACHFTLNLGVSAVASVAAKGIARVGVLTQYTGVLVGA